MSAFGFAPYGFEKRLRLRPIARLVIEQGYEGSHFAVWLGSGDQVYYGSAGHCSCNEPFDNVKVLGDLHPAMDFNEVWRAVRRWQHGEGRASSDELNGYTVFARYPGATIWFGRDFDPAITGVWAVVPQ